MGCSDTKEHSSNRWSLESPTFGRSRTESADDFQSDCVRDRSNVGDGNRCSLLRSSNTHLEVNVSNATIATMAALLIAGGCSSAGGNAVVPANVALRPNTGSGYTVTVLTSLGGTNSAANTINDRGWAMGTSFLSGNMVMHAALWQGSTVTDLKTLGGPNSAVEWPVENDRGYVSGISETSKKDRLGESTGWSCHVFLPDGGTSGDTCVGFVWHDGKMLPLPTLGGENGYGAGMNQRGEIAGWAETKKHDSTCLAPQVLQFLPAVWNAYTRKVKRASDADRERKDRSGWCRNRGQHRRRGRRHFGNLRSGRWALHRAPRAALEEPKARRTQDDRRSFLEHAHRHQRQRADRRISQSPGQIRSQRRPELHLGHLDRSQLETNANWNAPRRYVERADVNQR